MKKKGKFWLTIQVTDLDKHDWFDLPKSPLIETQKNPNINFSFVYVRISTLLVEPVPTLCPTLSGTKYSKRSDFVARVTIQVAGGFLHHFVYEFFLIWISHLNFSQFSGNQCNTTIIVVQGHPLMTNLILLILITTKTRHLNCKSMTNLIPFLEVLGF